MTTQSLLKGLSKDIGKLIDFNDEYNVIIRVGTPSNHHEFKAHSLILRARSSYFYTAFSSNWVRKQGNIIIFEKLNISPGIFEAILRYIYSGIFELVDREPSYILDLLCAADELMIDELTEHIQTYLIQNRSAWISENLIEILNIISPRAALLTLKKYCLEEITLLNPSTIFESDSFLDMDEIALVDLLERDDFGVNESELLYHVLKWGIRNTPSLSYILEDKNVCNSDNNEKSYDNEKNVYKWTSKDSVALKKTLKNCIPLIRFVHIPPIEFCEINKILPKELLEEMINHNLTENLSNYKIQPQRTCNIQIDSKLLNSKQAAIIASWLDDNHKSSSGKSIPYTFKLLFRASVDSPDLFHKKCDNVGPTIVIVKMRDNDCLIGGYNPLNVSWKRSWFSSSRGTKECFIFSLDSSVKTIQDKNAKLSRVISTYEEYAIYDHPWDGPCFGSGPDLWVNLNPDKPVGHVVKKCYQSSITNFDSFYWKDWEIFSVQRKE